MTEKNMDRKLPITGPCVLTDAQFKKAKLESRMLFAYANNYIQRHLPILKNSDVGIGLFDCNGNLMRVYSNRKRFFEWAKRIGFIPGTSWKETFVGSSAISMGLQTGNVAYSCGGDHIWEPLRDVFLYFVPCNSVRALGEQEKIFLSGGIALIGHIYDECQEFLCATQLMADATSRGIISGDHASCVIDSLSSGFLVLEKKPAGGFQIVVCSKKTYAALGISDHITPYSDAERYFDPLPRNKEFWAIVRERKIVSDFDITLSVLGKNRLITISTTTYLDVQSNVLSFSIAILSQKDVISQVTKRLGHYAKATFQDIIGESQAISKAMKLAAKAAALKTNILLLGESGVGKDIFAQAIHNASNQRQGPFVTLNCAAIPRDLLASELFGYEHGAFTGSKKDGQIGKFELANGGTLFLDEIGDMPLELQTLLLRVLEEKALTRLGGNIKIGLDVRIIAATNVDLEENVAHKHFRQDLYYRLNKFCITIPPLRERGGDIQLLLDAFYRSNSHSLYGEEYRIAPEILDHLASFPWRGNVRELQSFAEILSCLNPGDITSLDQIPDPRYRGALQATEAVSPGPPKPVKAKRYTMEHLISAEEIQKALLACRFNKVQTASTLGISRSTLYKLMKANGLK